METLRRKKHKPTHSGDDHAESDEIPHYERGQAKPVAAAINFQAAG